MGWSVMINDLASFWEFDEDTLETITRENPAYELDAKLALATAKGLNIRTCALAGGRTPNPYNGDEVVNISIVGFKNARVMVDAVMENIKAGPDA